VAQVAARDQSDTFARSLVGEAPSVEALRAQIRHLASFDGVRNPHVPTVLLLGETGTGKGLVARVMHASGPRAGGAFIDVNCAAIPETMLESELFGFEAGAFTDARRAKPGLFEAASGGTLFLDEIDALTTPLQSKLLKAIEEKEIRRLGATRPQRVDVKLVAATQRDLRALVESGRFRADLYHRLAVVILTVPPLRERGADVLVLARHFLEVYAGAHGLAPRRLGDDARAWLLAQPWPGNVRELGHLMERVTLLSPEATITRARLAELAVPAMTAPTDVFAPAGAAPAGGGGAAEDGDEAARIRDALARAGGNVVGAARLLGLGRNALRYRMRRHGIGRPALGAPAAATTGPSAPSAPVARAPTTPAAAPSAAAAPPAATRERKQVAVLAVEVTMPPGASPYEPWTAASRWRAAITDAVRGFGGALLPATPARLTAVFGAPRALEQTPARAVQAAFAVRRLAAETVSGPRPELRIALHVGAVEVEGDAAEPLARLLAVGDTLTLADRLLGHAGAGEILASEALARRVRAVCETQPRTLHVGPDAVPLAAHALVGPRPAAEAGGARFVGREPELGLLTEAFAGAAGGRGQVVFIAGDAGIGKSRLLAELRRRLAGHPHLWVEGHCASYGAATAFLPVSDGLRRFFGIDDHDDEAGAVAKVEAGIAALGADLTWTLPFVLGVLALGGDATAAATALDSASWRSEAFRSLKAILLRAAERQPMVLVVEDLHWIDPASEEAVAFIADAVPTTRALLICSHRPGYDRPLAERGSHVRLALRPLSGGEMAAMTGSLLGGTAVPAGLHDLIARKAEGNPFFVEEVTKSLLEDGTLERVDGALVLTRAASELAVPDTIQDVLLARIDRLPAEARRAIQVASVIGREFVLRLLARLVEAGDHVQSLVDDLRTLELIYEKATHPELAYMFKHALTHDVAYDSILPERRKLLHRTIGAAIEELYADRLAEHYETLAYHFARGEEWARAFTYHERAAEKAAATHANVAVTAHARAAEAVAAQLADGAVPDLAERRARLANRAGLAAFQLSDFIGAGAAFARAAALTADPEAQGLALADAGLGYFWGHDYAAAERVLDRAVAVADAHARPAVRAAALCNRGFARVVNEADFAAWEGMLAEAEGLCRVARHEVVDVYVRYQRILLAEWSADYARALALADQVVADARRLRLPHMVILPTWFAGKAACCLGRYGPAIARLEEAAAFCDRVGDRAWKSRILNTLGWCHAEIGSHERARAYNLQAAALAADIGDPEIVANSQLNLAANALALGDPDAAGRILEPIAAELERPGDPWMRWRYGLHVHDLAARLALTAGDPAAALACADAEIEGARRHRAVKLEARGLALRGRVLLVLERREDAGRALDEALAVATRIAYGRGAAVALGALADLARHAGRPADAARHDAARHTWAEGAAASLDDPDLRRTLLTT